MIIPEAQAISCSSTSFGTCSNAQLSKNFDNCSFRANAQMSGSITLSFSGAGSALCNLASAGSSVSRSPNFSITGVRGATFKVEGGTQTLTRGASNYSFSSSNITRTFTNAKGKVLLNLMTSTLGPLTITGSSRSNRTVSGGALRVTNLLTGKTCHISPNGIQYQTGCGCPVAGSLEGTCSDGGNYNLSFSTSCGSATVTTNEGTKSLSLDRCI